MAKPVKPAKDKVVQKDNVGLDSVLEALCKEHGPGAVMRFNSKNIPQVPVLSSGSVGLDLALGCGGFPRGRVVEIYGPESSGKTTMSLHVIAEAQKQGLTCAFIDAEHALDVKYAAQLGVNVPELLISQPDYGEQALEITEKLVSSAQVAVVVVDSVAALVPKSELDGEMGDAQMGKHARLMSQAMRKLTGPVSKSGALVIFINQTRSKIGILFGNPETTTGGNALKFYASVRVDIRRIGAIKVGETNIGNRTRARVVKNKMAPPFKEAEFDILYGQGISKAGEVLDMCVATGIVEKSGAWFSHNGERLGQGRSNTVDALRRNQALLDKVIELVKAKGDAVLVVSQPEKSDEDVGVVEESAGAEGVLE